MLAPAWQELYSTESEVNDEALEEGGTTAQLAQQAAMMEGQQPRQQGPAPPAQDAPAEEEGQAPASHLDLANLLFYGVLGQQMREGEAPSYFNPMEVGGRGAVRGPVGLVCVGTGLL